LATIPTPMSPRGPLPAPPERTETLRQSLQAALRQGWTTAHELSGLVGVREKDVATHLAHIDRTLRRQGEGLEMEPAACLACDFVFKKRDRLTRPARCPICNSERVTPPRFRIAGS
jgi:predicted Zn-ribbon and HTH transcriptional regulator